MVAIAAREAHHGRGQQAIELGAAFVCRHAVWMERVGSVHPDLRYLPAQWLRDLKRKSRAAKVYGTSAIREKYGSLAENGGLTIKVGSPPWT
jgi:hypothetical protein